MTTIYLSSTYEDLKEHRRIVYEALRRAGYTAIAMEDYVANDMRPEDKCLADVAYSDIYVGLFAFRYGYIPPPKHNNQNKLSITELELRHAERLEKPCLTFLVSEGAFWPRKFDDARKGRGEHINRLRDYLQTEKTASFFSSPHELASLVLATVNKHCQESEPITAVEPAPSQTITWDIDEKGSPFPGLMHFTKKFAPVFFGRDAEAREILDRLYTPEGHFMIVSGSSGTGKSSLVEAGVLPRLEESGLPGDKSCLCLRMVPSQGNHPFDALMRVLHPYAQQSGFDPCRLGEQLAAQPAIFTEQIQKIIANGIDHDALVLFVDQMEELFTARNKDKDLVRLDAFLSALYRGAHETPLWVIATLRSDFLHHCHGHPDLLQLLRSGGQYPIGPIASFMMDDIIVRPAQCAGLTISHKLVGQLVDDTGSEIGNLPLLAFVLQRLYEERQGNTLSERVYKDFGGVEGAIVDHIKTVEEELIETIGNEALNLLPQIFPLLLLVDVEGHITRRHALWTQFSVELRPIVDLLVKKRLLSTEREGETSTVSVAHEKLFDAWPVLTRWIAENRDDLRMLRQAELDAREWKRHEYGKIYLWHADRRKRLQEIIKRLGEGNIDTLVKQFAHPEGRLIEHLRNEPLSHEERQAIGMYLLELGDSRSGVGLTVKGIPDIDWVRIPGGHVRLGANCGTYQVEPFRIARYPVTNIQFQVFVEADDGYGNEKWWADLARRDSLKPPSWSEANHPRESVFWYEAVAFCRWLSIRLGYDVRLPTEWEWWQAATGGDSNNVYPWGSDWEAARCNSDESGLKRTTAVGMYPNGSTRQGVFDMAGNVWEWCLNKYDGPNDIRINQAGGRRVLRGGSWKSDPEGLRSAARNRGFSPVGRYNDVGFRLAQDLN